MVRHGTDDLRRRVWEVYIELYPHFGAKIKPKPDWELLHLFLQLSIFSVASLFSDEYDSPCSHGAGPPLVAGIASNNIQCSEVALVDLAFSAMVR